MGEGSLESRLNLSALRPLTHLNSLNNRIELVTATPLGISKKQNGPSVRTLFAVDISSGGRI